ncbi:hypothetical protein U9R90_10450 [Streptomyces sp. E11-3]|uniref:hypothetical protein n=1 Tax=Streptomyces sp. E11-3 TaxID=3110112 RepID=UPI00397FB4B8
MVNSLRTARPLRAAAAVTLILLATAACGEERPSASAGGGSPSAEAPQAPSPEARPRCAQAPGTPTPKPPATQETDAGAGDEPVPENPKYAENNAFKRPSALSRQAQASGDASAELVRKALTTAVEKSGGATADDITAVLHGLGCEAGNAMYVQGDGEWISYGVHTGDACVSGVVRGREVSAEAHGPYMEPGVGGSCDRPRGGH